MLSGNNYIFTNMGFRQIYDLYIKKKDDLTIVFPKALTYNLVNNELEFIDIAKIDISENIDFYNCRFIDSMHGKMNIIQATNDTKVLQYNISNTTVEPIMNYNHNVYNYIKNNKTIADLRLQSINNIINYGNPVPNVCSSDTVVKFYDKYPYPGKDSGFSIKKLTLTPDTNDPSVNIETYDEFLIFISSDIIHSYDFVCVI